MTPGHSEILLNESVLPDMGCPSHLAAGDINMMFIMSGKNRPRGQWLELLFCGINNDANLIKAMLSV